MTITTNDDELLTTTELVELTGITPKTLAALRARRQIPFVRLGGGRLVRYRRRDVLAWIESRVVAVGGAR